MTATLIDFCPQLVRAVMQGKKTLTFKPLLPAELAIVEADGTPTPPWGPNGALIFVAEVWGTARGKIIYLADCVGDGFRSVAKFPVGYSSAPWPTTLETSRILLRLVAEPQIVGVASAVTDEATAAKIVNQPSEGRTTYLDELKTQWATTYHGPYAWDQNPLCWRLEFARQT